MILHINNRPIGPGQPVYIVAEMSANHHQDFNTAAAIVREAKAAGADAVKLQTYTPDTITIDSNSDVFRVKGTIWEGKNLYDLYAEAYTPWEWQPKLKKIADEEGIALFSSPFDPTAVDFLESMKVPAYKIASFEIVDIPLIQMIADTGKPIVMSTGMATLEEIEEAVEAIRKRSNLQIVLLKCTSAYPAPFDEMNLKTIEDLAGRFGMPVGLSDHSLGVEVPVAAVALGACMIEKHFTLDRRIEGPDAAFSTEPHEFAKMVEAVRNVEQALGRVSYEPTDKERISRAYRRSLFAVEDIRAGEAFTQRSVRSIRPGDGLHPRHLSDILNATAKTDIARGTPLSWGIVNCSKDQLLKGNS